MIEKGDVVAVVGSESLPKSYDGRYGIVTELNTPSFSTREKVLVRFAHPNELGGSVSHTAIESDLIVVGKSL
jgi:hypothetical protein